MFTQTEGTSAKSHGIRELSRLPCYYTIVCCSLKKLRADQQKDFHRMSLKLDTLQKLFIALWSFCSADEICSIQTIHMKSFLQSTHTTGKFMHTVYT